jgi:hypothetical protein
MATGRFNVLDDRIAKLLTLALADASVLIVHNVLTLHKNLALTAALARLHAAETLPPVVVWCRDFAWTDPLPLHALGTSSVGPGPGVRYVAVSADRQRTSAGLLGIAADEIAVCRPASNSLRS